MSFRQLFDSESSTYTYLMASRLGGEALIIDPVLEKVDRYLQLLDELDLRDALPESARNRIEIGRAIVEEAPDSGAEGGDGALEGEAAGAAGT